MSADLGLVACAETTPTPQKPRGHGAADDPGPGRHPQGTADRIAGAPAAARPYLLATVTVCSMDRLLANGTKLVGQAMPLPMDAVGLRDMILSQAGLPPEVAANMDFASPSAAAFVALDGKGKSGAVLAVPARGPAEAQKIIDALGKKITTRGAGDAGRGQHGRPRLALQTGQHRGAERRCRRAGARDDADAGGAPPGR